ncbi:MAG TPA: hypothetical protein VFN97_24735 [Actinospica sp.]|nr:hypothetical protein [Actinospica sp.]
MQDDDEDEVVFIDDADEDDTDREDGESWLAEERLESAYTDGMLPPGASRHRLLVSLIALALFFGGTAAAFTAAYHRHLTDLKLANLLELTAASSPPQIPGLTDLGFAATWHAQVQEQVIVPVVSQSPRPVELLDAVLQEPGMVGTATLRPTGETTLRTGQTGALTGTVTVDCAKTPPVGYPSLTGDPSFVIPAEPSATLRVRARTSGGRIAQATVDPEAGQGYGTEMQQRICTQQGGIAVSSPTESTHYNPSTHILTVDWSATSKSDSPLWYSAALAISSPGDDGTAPCTITSMLPAHGQPYIGTLEPGATLAAHFDLQMSACPSGTAPPATEQLYLDLELAIDGTDVVSEQDSYPVTLG